MVATAMCSAAVVAPRAAVKAQAGVRPLPAARPAARTFAAVQRSVKPQKRSSSALQATASMEVAQVAVDTGLIFGAGAVMVGITLIGLAFGFVLLRVESLAEEGKI